MSDARDTDGASSAAHGRFGFTFMEILVALCIVLIALVPLIHLHVISIRMTDSSSRIAAATLVANDRLAEILAMGTAALGKSSGRVEDQAGRVLYRWTSVVTDAAVPELESARLMGLRQVHVDVTWRDGERDAVVSLDTLIHTPVRGEREILDDSNADESDKSTALPRSQL
ncbi:MAG: type II secretion system protein [Sedimentisphaerales bacterium]|nr:type II secretion system protein [Sedimentisphaerales bacterium]